MLDIEEIKAAQEVMQELMESGEPVAEEEIIEQSVRPLLRAWGYRGLDVKTQYSVKIGSGTKKLDFVICVDKAPVMLIECKALEKDVVKDTDIRNQLRSYFNMLSRECDVHIGVLTNGNNYVFFADADDKHLMDKECYASFKFVNLKESEFKDTLDRYSKSEIVKFKKREALLADVRLQKFRAGSKRVADALVHRQGVVPEYLIQSIAEDSGIKDDEGSVNLSKEEAKEFASIFKACVTNAYKDSIGTGEPESIKAALNVASDASTKPVKKEASKPTKKESVSTTASTSKVSNTKSKKIALELNQEYDIGVNADSWGKKTIGHFVINGTQYVDKGEGISLREVYCKLVKHVFDTMPELKENIVETYAEKRIAYTAQLKEALDSDSTPEKDKNYIKNNGWKEVEGSDVSVFMWYDADGMIRSMKKFLDRVSLPYDTVKISFNAAKTK